MVSDGKIKQLEDTVYFVGTQTTKTRRFVLTNEAVGFY